MGGLAYFHDSASGGFPDYCHRKYLRPIRRVYLGAYKKGAFLDQYDSVQNGIKTNYVTFKKLLEVLPLIVLRFFHQSCCASPLNCGAVSLLSCWQQQHQTQKLYILPLSCCIGSEYLGLKVILPQWPGFPLKLFSPNINTHKKRPWFHIKVIIMVMLSKSDVLNKKPLS